MTRIMEWLGVEANRAYVYRVALAVIAVLVGVGVLTDESAPLVIGLLAALLPTGLAVVNTTTSRDG
jgi:uncharacterized membrane protein YkgB